MSEKDIENLKLIIHLFIPDPKKCDEIINDVDRAIALINLLQSIGKLVLVSICKCTHSMIDHNVNGCVYCDCKQFTKSF